MVRGVDIATRTIKTWKNTPRTPNIGRPGDTHIIRHTPLTAKQNEVVRAAKAQPATWKINGVMYKFVKLVSENERVEVGGEGDEVTYKSKRGMLFAKVEASETSAKRKRGDENDDEAKKVKKKDMDATGGTGVERCEKAPPNEGAPPPATAPPATAPLDQGAAPNQDAAPLGANGIQQAVGPHHFQPLPVEGLVRPIELLAPHPPPGGIDDTEAPMGLPVVDWDDTDDASSGAIAGDDEVIVTLRRSDFARMVGCGRITPRLANRVACGVGCKP